MKQSLPKQLARVLFLLVLIGISVSSYTNSGGPATGNTGAPSETACGGCHGPATISGTNYNAITLTGIASNSYVAGQTYTVTISGNAAATSRNGFQITSLNSSNAAAGTFTAGTGNTASSAGGRNYVTHNSTGNTQTSWSFQWTAPNPSVGNITFYLAFNATNANSATSGDIVYAKTFTITSAVATPVATITSPANASVFCVGDTVQFTGTATNSPTSFAWDFLGNTPASSAQQNPRIVLGPNTGSRTIRFRATNAGGTSPNAQIVINVVAKPTATITSSNTVICGTDSVTLTANAGNGLTYLWSPGGQITQTIKTATPGNYTVRVTNTGNCSVTSAATTLTAGVKPSLTATLSSNNLCIGDSLEITATAGLQNYKYFFGSTLMDSSVSNKKKFLINTSLSTIFVTGSNGVCTSDPDIKSVSVSTKPSAPSISCGPVNSNFVSFTITGNNPQISLDSGKTYITPNQGNTHLITGLSPNTQILAFARTSTSAPCLFSLASSKSCASANCTPLTLQIKAPRYICTNNPNSDKMIRVVSTNAINPYYKFDYPQPFPGSGWTKSDSFPAQTNVPLDRVHKVTVIDSANAFCPTKDTSFTITVVNIQAISLQLNLDKVKYCSGESITFDISNPIPSNINKLIYYTVVGSNRIEFGAKAKPNYKFGPVPLNPNFPNGTIVTAQALDSASGCGIFSNNATINVDPLPNVGFTFAKANLEVELTDTSSNTVRRNWIIDGDTFPTTNKVYRHVFGTAGSKVILMDGFTANDCKGSLSLPVNVVATGLLDAANILGMQLFPNPANDKVTINWGESVGQLQLKIYDQLGKLLLTKEVIKGEQLDLKSFAAGVYTVQLNSDDKQSQIRLVIGN